MISLLAFCLASYLLTRIALRLSEAAPAGESGARPPAAPARKKGQKTGAPAPAGDAREAARPTAVPHARAEMLLLFATTLLLLITLTGYWLSACNSLQSLGSWTLCACGVLAATVATIKLHRPWRDLLARPRPPAAWWPPLPAERARVLLLALMAATVGVVLLIVLYAAVKLAPASPDVLEYHLARVAHYLQLHNFSHYFANYYAQDCQPKIGAIAMLYAILAGGLNDHYAQLVQVLAYLIAMTAVYGITRKLGAPPDGGIFAACTFGLLTIVITEASTAQNDLLFAAYLGCFVYALLAYRQSGTTVHFAWACVAFALAAGIKATMLFNLPSLALIAYFVGKSPMRAPVAARPKPAWWLAVAALLVIILPASYGENLVYYHNAFGPPQAVAQLSLRQLPAMGIVHAVVLNLFRYAMEFFTIDGFWQTPFVATCQLALKYIPQHLFPWLGLHLDSPAYSLVPFSYAHRTIADEESSYWGILGFALIWPSVWVALLRKRVAGDVKTFAAAALLFFLVISLAMPYDWWHGRFFIACAIYAAPVLGCTLYASRRLATRVYVAAVVILGCVSALLGALACKSYALTTTDGFGKPLATSTFALHAEDPVLARRAQLTREAPGFYDGLRVYDQLVPPTATVGIDAERKYLPEYLFFGEHYTRRIIPISEFAVRGQPLPAQLDYLVYSEGSPYAHPGDPLFVDSWTYGKLYLRNMHP